MASGEVTGHFAEPLRDSLSGAVLSARRRELDTGYTEKKCIRAEDGKILGCGIYNMVSTVQQKVQVMCNTGRVVGAELFQWNG